MSGLVRSDEERQRIVEAYRSSGMTVESFAAQQGISTSTLYEWMSRSRQRSRVPALARVMVKPRVAAVARAANAALVLEYGRGRISIGDGFDRHLLSQVLSVLDERA